MIKFLLLSILTINISFASSTISAKYTVSKIIKNKGKNLIGFKESATYYQVEKKEDLSCIQKSINESKKVEIVYDYKTYQIKSCQIVK